MSLSVSIVHKPVPLGDASQLCEPAQESLLPESASRTSCTSCTATCTYLLMSWGNACGLLWPLSSHSWVTFWHFFFEKGNLWVTFRHHPSRFLYIQLSDQAVTFHGEVSLFPESFLFLIDFCCIVGTQYQNQILLNSLRTRCWALYYVVHALVASTGVRGW